MSNQFNSDQQSAEQLIFANLSNQSSEIILLRQLLIEKQLEINQLKLKYNELIEQLHRAENLNESHQELDQQYIHHNMIISRLEQSIDTIHSLNISLQIENSNLKNKTIHQTM